MHRGRQCAALSVVALVLVGFTNGYWGQARVSDFARQTLELGHAVALGSPLALHRIGDLNQHLHIRAHTSMHADICSTQQGVNPTPK